MDLLDQMAAEAEVNMDVNAHEELEMELASARSATEGKLAPAATAKDAAPGKTAETVRSNASLDQ